MSNTIDKIHISGQSYDIKDSSAAAVVELTQQEYDALPSSAKTGNTLFVITDATPINITDYYTKSETNTLLNAKVETSAITTSISSSSTDNEIPTAKAVYDALNNPSMIVKSLVHKLADYTTESAAVPTPYEKNGVVWASYDGYEDKLNFGGMGGKHFLAPFSTDFGTACHFYLSDESPIYSITFVMRTDTIDTMKNNISTAVTAAYDVYDGVPSDAEITIPTGTSGYEWGAVTYQLKNGATPLTAITTDYVDSYLRIAEIYVQYESEIEVPIADKVNELSADLGGLSLVKLTESEYTALVTKDSETLYVVVPDPSN